MHSTQAERQHLLAIMSRHVGAEKGINMEQLSKRMMLDARQCRRVITDLREEGHAICGKPTTGYYVAANAEDLDACCLFLRGRAMHSLRLEARLRHLALPDLINQLRFTEV
jgi:hypothetical protein